MYLIVNHANGYLEEKNENKYLIFDNITDVLKKYKELWNGIKIEIETINGGKEIACDKDFMKIKFNSDDDLSLNKPLKFHAMTIVVRSVFEDGKLYPQNYLDECLHELRI